MVISAVTKWWDRSGNKDKKTKINELITAINANAAAVAAVDAVPVGAIFMWSGTLANIPDGYALCDGVSGRPNLLDKFVKGVTNGSDDPGDTGGSTGHNHSGNTLELTLGFTRVESRPDKGPYEYQTVSGSSTRSAKPTWYGATSWQNHEPVYYEVAFIIKT